MRLALALLLSVTASTAGCVSAADTSAKYAGRLVAVADIMGGIKCALATALYAERTATFKRLQGRVAQLELSLKVVDTSSYNGGVKGEPKGPFVLATSYGAGSILPRFSGSVTRTNTIDTVIKLRLGLQGTETEVCDKYEQVRQIDYNFTRWLSNVISGLDTFAGFTPAGIVDSIKYDGSFQIVRKAGGGVAFDIVFVSGDFGADADNNDVQHITMTIQAATKEVPFPSEVYGTYETSAAMEKTVYQRVSQLKIPDTGDRKPEPKSDSEPKRKPEVYQPMPPESKLQSAPGTSSTPGEAKNSGQTVGNEPAGKKPCVKPDPGTGAGTATVCPPAAYK